MQVRNQAYLRRKNKESIVKLLRERTQSYSDLARALKLSNTAIGKIADDLIAQDIIRRGGESKGRTGINLSINVDLGYIVAIDLSGRKLQVCAADFGSNILMRRELTEVLSFGREDLSRLIGQVKEIVEALPDKKLHCISIASPGKIDPVSGEFLLNPRFKGFEGISLARVFEETFGCPAFVKNDINLALEGERMYGSLLKEVKNALMFHVDVGTGAALLVDGKVYEGSHGFAGEIGYLKLDSRLSSEDDFANLNFSNYYDSVSLFSSLLVLRRCLESGEESLAGGMLREKGLGTEDLTIPMMAEAYRAKDALVRRIVDASGRVIAGVACGLYDFLDVEILLLNGSVTEFGPDFLKNVSACMGGRQVAYSDMMENATLFGAISSGLTQSYQILL